MGSVQILLLIYLIDAMKPPKPPNPKHIEEAKLAGIKLLRRAPEGFPNSNIYECPKCNEEIQIRIETVRAKGQREATTDWDCENCKWLDYHNEAKAVGLTIVGKTENTHYLVYRFDSCGHKQEIQKASVKRNEFKCQTCWTEQLEYEASLRQLKLVGKSKTLNYRLYEHNLCSHRHEYTVQHVRKYGKLNPGSPYPCKTCLNDKLLSEARTAGLLLYGKSNRRAGNGDVLYLYQAECGHSIERQASQVRRKEWRCHACTDQKLNNEAEASGLRLLGRGKNKSFRTYQFKDCGHAKEISTGSVRAKTFHCDICFWDEKDEILFQRGVEIAGPGSGGNNRLFRFIKCGHLREFELAKALDGSFVCHECDETWYTLPSNLYVLQIAAGNDQWLKVGVAKVLDTRIKQYGLPDIASIDIKELLPCATGKDALDLESAIRIQFGNKRLEPENMRRWHKYSGFTECYPISLVEDIKANIQLLYLQLVESNG